MFTSIPYSINGEGEWRERVKWMEGRNDVQMEERRWSELTKLPLIKLIKNATYGVYIGLKLVTLVCEVNLKETFGGRKSKVDNILHESK
jgi:hypothetical protein